MKLLFNEFIKLWNKPSVIISVLLLIVVNSGLWFISMSVQQSNSYNYKDYIVLKSSYDSKPLQDAFESINETVHNLESYKQYEVYQSIPDVIPSKEEFFDEIFNDFRFINEYQSYVDEHDLHYQYLLYSEVQTYYQQIIDYQRYVGGVKQNTEKLKKMPVWKSYSSGKQAYYEDLELLYAKLDDVTLESTNHISVESILSINSSLLLLIFALFLVLSIFNIDESSKMDDLLLITKYGRSRTTFHKVLVLIFSVSAISFLIHGVELFVSQVNYGWINWNIPVQSIPSLYTVPYKLSLGGWYIWMVLGRTLALVALSCLFGAFYHFFSNKKHSILLYNLVLVLSAFAFIMISDTMAIVWLKYINLYALINTQTLLSQYRIIEFFNFVIPVSQIHMILIGVILLGSFFTIFIKRLSQKRLDIKFKLNFNKFSNALFKRLNLFTFEGYKLFVMQKGWIVVLIVVSILGSFISQTMGSYTILDSQRQLANYYGEYGGELTQDKISWIENENERYLMMQQNLQEAANQYQNEEISSEVYYQIIDNYTIETADRNLFLDYYAHYLERESNVLIYPTGYQTLFSMNTNARDFRNSIILLLGIIFVLSPIVSQDREQKMDELYSVTKKGGFNLKRSKVILGIGYATVYICLFTFVELLAFSFVYTMSAWNAHVMDVLPQNLEIQSQWILNLQLWQYFGFVLMLRIATASAIAVIIIGISRLFRSPLITYVVSIAVFFVPIMLKYIGNRAFELLSVDCLLMGNAFVYNGMNVFNILVIFGFAFVLLFQFLTINTNE